MEKYRLSKYDPGQRDALGVYRDMDWTSYSDIGKNFHGCVFAKEAYLAMEKKYCDALMEVLQCQNIKSVKVKNLEYRFTSKEIEAFFNEKGLRVTAEEAEILESIKENDIIMSENIEPYIRLLLRECFWCILEESDSEMYLEVGYDYYVYVYCNTIDQEIIEKKHIKRNLHGEGKNHHVTYQLTLESGESKRMMGKFI